MNPYTNRVTIRNPENFYNRKTEVKKIFSRIGGSRPQSISVVGERRIGKSSLLYYVCNERVRKKFLRDFEDYIFVFCDLQQQSDMDVDDFFTFVTKLIAEKAPEFFEENPLEKVTYDPFRKLIQNIDKSGKKIILALDEFDVVTKNEKFGREFFSYLRSIANRLNVAYITSSRKDLQELCHAHETKDTVFYNIYTHIPIGLFDKESALELISKPSEREGIPLEKYTEFIVKLAGYHPFFIQIACANLFEYLESHKSIDEKGFETVKKDFLNEAECHFDDMLKDLKDEEQLCLSALAESKDLDRKLQFIARKLAKRGVLQKDDGIYKIFSESFKDFIMGKN